MPKFPDPSSSNELANGLPKVSLEQLGISSSQYQAAQSACAHLLASGITAPTQAAELIDELRSSDVSLIYNPATNTLSTTSDAAISVG